MSDNISRQAVLEAIQKHFNPTGEEMPTEVAAVLVGVGVVISTQPSTDRKGHWVKISPASIYECSVCHQDVMTTDIEAYGFCHHCGADMRGDTNECE